MSCFTLWRYNPAQGDGDSPCSTYCPLVPSSDVEYRPLRLPNFATISRGMKVRCCLEISSLAVSSNTNRSWWYLLHSRPKKSSDIASKGMNCSAYQSVIQSLLWLPNDIKDSLRVGKVPYLNVWITVGGVYHQMMHIMS